MQLSLQNEQATEHVAAKLAQQLTGGTCLFLCGDLGAGKTTFVRAMLRALGVKGAVKSPTYTLIEPYELAQFTVYHLDLYRISAEEELDYLGLDDCFLPAAVALIEWPERGGRYLPTPDLVCQLDRLSIDNNEGRQLRLTAHTRQGDKLLMPLREGQD